jgi:hypothetical protein
MSLGLRLTSKLTDVFEVTRKSWDVRICTHITEGNECLPLCNGHSVVPSCVSVKLTFLRQQRFSTLSSTQLTEQVFRRTWQLCSWLPCRVYL